LFAYCYNDNGTNVNCRRVVPFLPQEMLTAARDDKTAVLKTGDLHHTTWGRMIDRRWAGRGRGGGGRARDDENSADVVTLI